MMTTAMITRGMMTTATTETRRPLTRLLAPLMLAGTLGAGGALQASGAAHALAAQPATQRTARTSTTTRTSTRVAAHGVRLTISSGTSADYRAREQLAFFSFPTDAVGTTNAVTGRLVLDVRDRIVPSQSKIVIDLRTLKSDKSQRDQFIQSNTLQTDQYPDVVFSVVRAVGLPSALPTSGTLHFSLIGNLTVHGVTRSTTWTVTATLGSKTVTGQASTRVKLTSFGMSPPQVGPVLSVNDTITLQINARLARTTV